MTRNQTVGAVRYFDYAHVTFDVTLVRFVTELNRLLVYKTFLF